ncbi:hypothetical protein [Chryseobacterium indoltheticum]|uniref:hypothetical protein n=1 Tax=Chryseobacterium indoltheticum TaxID=254 RepID=UPI003F49632C
MSELTALNLYIMNIQFTTINKKEPSSDYQRDLWNSVENFIKKNARKKLDSFAKQLNILNLNIIIDMDRGIAIVNRENISEEVFLLVKNALRSKCK